MVTSPIELVLAKLPDAKRNQKGWIARCPAHEDRNPSLSIATGADGRALLRCHAGCTVEAIVNALGLTLADLMPRPSSSGVRNKAKASFPSPTKQTKFFGTAHDAVAVLERQYGKPSAYWTYRDATGKPVGVVARWDTANGKSFRPVSRHDSNRWVIGGMAEPRPLYGLPELLGKPTRVFVCEGEKSADAARGVGLLATTSPHGSKSAAKADWAPLAGREVVLLPDDDDAGERYANDVADLLATLSPRPKVKVIRLPDLPGGEGGDMADFVIARGGNAEAIKAEVEALADNTEPIQLNGKIATCQPRQPIEPSPPFPAKVLPEPVASFVVNSARALGCDSSFVGLPLLVGLASAIGNSREIQLKRGWREPAILWGAIIGESGSTKSPALELALRAISRRQDRQMLEHREALAKWEGENQVFEAKRANWNKKATANPESAESPPEGPQAPVCQRCSIKDTTIEAMVKLLQDNPRGLLMIRDELAGWLHFDRYSSSGRGAEASQWLETFGARSLVVDRKTSGTLHVPRAAVSIIGGIQLGIMAKYVGQEHRENGLLARLLLAMPPRRAKQWNDADVDSKSEAVIENIFEKLYSLKPALSPEGEPKPAIIELMPEAQKDWKQFYNQHNQELADLTGDLAAAWSKLECYAARFALVIHCIREVASDLDPDQRNIDAKSIAAGVELCRWFGHEAKRVYAMLGEDEGQRERWRLVELIERRGGQVSVRDWQRARSHQTAEDAESELTELATAGHGRLEETAPGPRGGRPSKRFVLTCSELNTGETAVPKEEGISNEADLGGGDSEWGEL